MSVKYRCLLFQWLCGTLVLAPSVVYMISLFSTAEESEMEGMTPFAYYVVAAALALMAGYGLMRKNMQEEERERIKAIVREITQETMTKGDVK